MNDKCPLCEVWNATHHSRYLTTPMQPHEGEMLMVLGYRKGVKVGRDATFCDKHGTVLRLLDQRDNPETVAVAPVPVPVLVPPEPAVPLSTVEPASVAAPIPHAASLPQLSVQTLDQLLPSTIPIPDQQPVRGKPLTVPCPSCNAPIGVMCKVPQGNELKGFHKRRIEAASPELGNLDEFVPVEGEGGPGGVEG